MELQRLQRKEREVVACRVDVSVHRVLKSLHNFNFLSLKLSVVLSEQLVRINFFIEVDLAVANRELLGRVGLVYGSLVILANHVVDDFNHAISVLLHAVNAISFSSSERAMVHVLELVTPHILAQIIVRHLALQRHIAGDLPLLGVGSRLNKLLLTF